MSGDKYENGVITPRPPPVYNNTGGRFRDQNRRPRNNWQERPMQNQQGPMQNQQGGSMQSPPNSWGPMQGDGRNYRTPQNAPPQQNYPSQQNVPPQQNYPPQQNFVNPGQGEGRGPMSMNNTGYAPGGRDFYQADRRGPAPSYQGNYNQGPQGTGYPSQADQRGYGQSNFGRDNNNMNYTRPSPGGTHGPGTGPNYGQSWQGTGQGFSQAGRENLEGDNRSYEPLGQTGTNQVRNLF